MNNLEIAQRAKPKPILQVAEEVGRARAARSPEGQLIYAGRERRTGGSMKPAITPNSRLRCGTTLRTCRSALGSEPAAARIDVDASGRISGLF